MTPLHSLDPEAKALLAKHSPLLFNEGMDVVVCQCDFANRYQRGWLVHLSLDASAKGIVIEGLADLIKARPLRSRPDLDEAVSADAVGTADAVDIFEHIPSQQHQEPPVLVPSVFHAMDPVISKALEAEMQALGIKLAPGALEEMTQPVEHRPLAQVDPQPSRDEEPAAAPWTQLPESGPAHRAEVEPNVYQRTWAALRGR